MFQDTNLEEGTTAKHVPREKDDTNLISVVEMKRIWSMGESIFRGVVRKWLPCTSSRAAKHHDLYGFFGDINFLTMCILSMILDPLFLYTPVINDELVCFRADEAVQYLAMIGSLCPNMVYLIIAVSKMKIGLSQNSWRSALVLLIDCSIILPLPQALMILTLSRRINGTMFFFGMNFFLVQHLLKLIRLRKVYKKIKTSGVTFNAWAHFAFYLCFFHAANVIGAIWYFLAVERKLSCWRKAYKPDDGRDNLSFFCPNSLENNHDVSICSTKTENTTTYDFGIFRDAIQSGVVERTSFFRRFIICLRWSLQNLSSFGQGLPFSTNLFDNVFVMFITIFGVLLFFFLIAKVQLEISKSEERRQKELEIGRWMPFGKLPKNLQQQLKVHLSLKWRESSRDVDIHHLVNSLSDNLGQEVKRTFCLPLLKKVEEFGNLSDPLLEILCALTDPVFYEKRSYIVRERDPIDQMLFVLQGKLWTYTSNTITDHENNTGIPPQNNEFCGVELVSWAQAEASNNPPASTRTIQTLTNVEAFVLMANDLRNGLRMIIHRENKAASCIQLFWRSKRNAKTSTTKGAPPSPSERLSG